MRSEGVVPEMRVASKRAGGGLEVDLFGRELGESVTLANEGLVALTRFVCRRHLIRVGTSTLSMGLPCSVGE